jgi:hypothetical protein
MTQQGGPRRFDDSVSGTPLKYAASLILRHVMLDEDCCASDFVENLYYDSVQICHFSLCRTAICTKLNKNEFVV